LINNAASAGELLRLEELDPGKLQELYTLNIVAPVWLTGFFYKQKLENSRLRIIDISSGAAHTALPGLAPYCGTKAALSMSGKVFAEENRDDKNLALMSYEPGTVATEMQEQLKDQSPEIFPSYNLFKTSRDNNMLVKPEIVVKNIADFLEANNFGYSHKRYDSNS
jgi:short-subunit dehydrogenase